MSARVKESLMAWGCTWPRHTIIAAATTQERYVRGRIPICETISPCRRTTNIDGDHQCADGSRHVDRWTAIGVPQFPAGNSIVNGRLNLDPRAVERQVRNEFPCARASAAFSDAARHL